MNSVADRVVEQDLLPVVDLSGPGPAVAHSPPTQHGRRSGAEWGMPAGPPAAGPRSRALLDRLEELGDLVVDLLLLLHLKKTLAEIGHLLRFFGGLHQCLCIFLAAYPP